MTLTRTHPQERFPCADCGERPAVVYLPEGRYLCHPCWDALRSLRQAVHHATSTRKRNQQP